MKVGTGSKAVCLGNNSGYALPIPGPTLADRGVPDPVRISPIRVVLTFAPVELAYRPGYGNRRHATQAARCPYCHALVAVGPSWEVHTHFCRRGL